MLVLNCQEKLVFWLFLLAMKHGDKPVLGELLALELCPWPAHHWNITHFKESGDVYPHDSDGWPVDPGRAGGLGDQ